ncbi:hypothetical protein QFZ33_003405 [Arthrobacter globiformis]|nr:hypothetical protein [Arthrobacter globiformis]
MWPRIAGSGKDADAERNEPGKAAVSGFQEAVAC